MADLQNKTFAETYPKLLQDPGDGTIQKSDGTPGATTKADLTGGNTFSGVQDFTGRIDADSGISFDGGTNVLSDYKDGISWTPEYVPESGSFSSITYNVQSGVYYKIGGISIFRFRIRTSGITVGTASGVVSIPIPTSGTGAGFVPLSNAFAGTFVPKLIRTFGGDIFLRDIDENQLQVTDLDTGASSNSIIDGIVIIIP